MGKCFRRLLPLLLPLLLPVVAQAQFNFTTNTDNATYTNITITGYTVSSGDVTIPYSTNGLPVTAIGTNAFRNNYSITNVSIPDSVIRISDAAFYNCANLTSISIGTNLMNIGGGSFYGCGHMKAITIPDSVTNIAVGAFWMCVGLTNVTLGTNVATIGAKAFYNCWGLKSVTIPDSVSNIGSNAFYYCFSVTNISIGKGVASIGTAAFGECQSSTNITVDPLNSCYRSVEGVLFTYDLSTLVQCPAGKAGTYAVPGSVTNIGPYAFSGCALTNVTIGSSVTVIRNYTFESCYSLSSVAIGANVTNIQDRAFSSCTSLEALYFQGNAPTEGGAYVFYNCTNAIAYYLPGTTGWDHWISPPPAVLWRPQIQPSDGSFGVQTNQFGFNVVWTSGRVVVVEACTNLASSTWLPLQTNTLSADSLYFSDPDWTNYPARLYRIRSP